MLAVRPQASAARTTSHGSRGGSRTTSAIPHGPPGLASPPRKMSIRPRPASSYERGRVPDRVERVERETGQRAAEAVDRRRCGDRSCRTRHRGTRRRSRRRPPACRPLRSGPRRLRADPPAHRAVRVERDDTALLAADVDRPRADDDLLAPVLVEVGDGRARLDSRPSGPGTICTGCGQPRRSRPLRPSSTCNMPDRSAVTTSRWPSPLTSAITGDDKCVGPSGVVHAALGNFGGPAAAAGRETHRRVSRTSARWRRGRRQARARRSSGSSACGQDENANREPLVESSDRMNRTREAIVLYPRPGRCAPLRDPQQFAQNRCIHGVRQ